MQPPRPAAERPPTQAAATQTVTQWSTTLGELELDGAAAGRALPCPRSVSRALRPKKEVALISASKP